MNGNPIVLVVEDNEYARKTIQAFLQTLGLEVILTASGQEALLRLSDHIAVIITDFNMPHMHGVELARQAKQRHPKMPIIIMSGNLAEAQSTAANLGMTDQITAWVEKPWRFARMQEMLRQAGVLPVPITT